MKKILFSLFVLSLVVLMASPAFALQCKEGNWGSDECWTEVEIQSGYTTIVSKGHVLVASIEGVTAANNDGFLARHAIASKPGALLGVAQKAIATGDRALILARGRGVVQTVAVLEGTAVTSGDRLVTTEGSTIASRAGSVVRAANGVSTAYDDTSTVGTSLETQTADDSENIAYIQIV